MELVDRWIGPELVFCRVTEEGGLTSVTERVTSGWGCWGCCCGSCRCGVLSVTDREVMGGCMLFVGLGVRGVGVGSGLPLLGDSDL
jgi:hypothetical protein